MTRTDDFETRLADALAAVSSIPGWMTDEQARALFTAATALDPGQRIVEIGSHRGRSTIVLAKAAASGVEIVAIDPFARPERPRDDADGEEISETDLLAFHANLEGAGVLDRIRHVRALSQDALAIVDGPVDLLYIDGAHEFTPARSDVRNWGSRVAPGGTMFVHDAYSSVGVTAAQIVELFFGSSFRYAGRSRSLAEFQRQPTPGLRRIGNAMRQSVGLGWFMRNVAVKLAIRGGVPAVSRALGHEGTDYPY